MASAVQWKNSSGAHGLQNCILCKARSKQLQIQLFCALSFFLPVCIIFLTIYFGHTLLCIDDVFFSFTSSSLFTFSHCSLFLIVYFFSLFTFYHCFFSHCLLLLPLLLLLALLLQHLVLPPSSLQCDRRPDCDCGISLQLEFSFDLRSGSGFLYFFNVLFQYLIRF